LFDQIANNVPRRLVHLLNDRRVSVGTKEHEIGHVTSVAAPISRKNDRDGASPLRFSKARDNNSFIFQWL
jgi:hypothetical protein